MGRIKYKRTYDYTRKAGRNLYKDNNENVLGDWVHAELVEKERMTVTVEQHDIKYKEQYWKIPERTIEYCVELITDTAKNIAASKATHEEDKNGLYEELARFGVMRYYRVYTLENVAKNLTTLGYISVYEDNGKVNTNVYLPVEKLKKERVNTKKVNNDLNKLINRLVKHKS